MRCRCILCGGPIHYTGYPDWMRTYQALYTVRELWDEVRLSGVGGARGVPLDEWHPDITRARTNNRWMSVSAAPKPLLDPGHAPYLPAWGFPAHCACWEILWQVNPELREPAALQALFQLCRSQPFYPCMIYWDHHYGGITSPLRCGNLPNEVPLNVTVDYDNEIYQMDPGDDLMVEVSDIQQYFDPSKYRYRSIVRKRPRDLLQTTGEDTENQAPKRRKIEEGDAPRRPEEDTENPRTVGLNDMPEDILLAIYRNLSSADVGNLRQTCSALSVTRLGATFWKTRFQEGYECHCLVPLLRGQNLQGKWRGLYIKSLTDKSLRNRKRIWKLASEINEMVTTSLSSTKSELVRMSRFIHASSDTIPENDGQTWQVASSGTHAERCWHGTSISEAFSHKLFESHLVLGGPIIEITTALIKISGKTFISGFKFVKKCGEVLLGGYGPSKPSLSGVWKASSSEPGDSFAGFFVAIEPRGIRGLRVVTGSGNRSQWFGDHNDLPKKQILSQGDGVTVEAIKGGFDALKLVSVSLMGSPGSRLGESRLWFPDLPVPNITASEVHVPKLLHKIDKWIPYSQCYFGGRDGKLLPRLTRITVQYRATSEFHAIKFGYSGPDEQEISLQAGILQEGTRIKERTLKLDSGNGERLIGVDATYNLKDWLVKLKFHTNRGQRLAVPMRVKDCKSRTVHRLRPGDGEIVGFFAQMRSPLPRSYQDNGIMNLGILTLPNGEIGSPRDAHESS